ncbi:hypothetical protein J6590_066741 [Homalodisca vitripennis]|nr:hypothetical protein J6590_066741 [Homalodisca vitripennis]
MFKDKGGEDTSVLRHNKQYASRPTVQPGLCGMEVRCEEVARGGGAEKGLIQFL